MSALQPQTPITSSNELSFFLAIEGETSGQETMEFTLPEGNFKTTAKQYGVSYKEPIAYSKEIKEVGKLYSKQTGLSEGKDSKGSPIKLMADTALKKPQQMSPSTGTQGLLNKEQTPLLKTTVSTPHPLAQQKGNEAEKGPSSTTVAPQRPSESSSPMVRLQKNEVHSRTQERKEGHKEGLPLTSRNWSKEETKEWWEQRYHQKERQDDGQKQGQRDGRESDEEKPIAISKSGAIKEKNSSNAQSDESFAKPFLPRPSLGVFALYFILTKLGIYSDGTSNFAYKKEIELIDGETTVTHKKRLEELKEVIRKEKETETWGIMAKVFSWMASFFAIFAGIALIATGVGAIAGALLIVGGLIQVTNQIMDLTGGWKKIAEILPGDDTEKKRAVISWMQIGIAVLCLILSAAGVIWGGFSNFGEVMAIIPLMTLEGIINIGSGVTAIGEGITKFFYFDKMGDIRKHDMKLTRLKHERKDLMEKVELGVDRLEQLFEDLARSLQFEEELFMADQMINRR